MKKGLNGEGMRKVGITKIGWKDSWDNQDGRVGRKVGITKMGWEDNWDNQDELGGQLG